MQTNKQKKKDAKDGIWWPAWHALSQRAETCPPCPLLSVLAGNPGLVRNQCWDQEEFQEEICEKLLQHFRIRRFFAENGATTFAVAALCLLLVTPLAFKHPGLSPALVSSWNQKLSFGIFLLPTAQAFIIPSPPSPERTFQGLPA